MYSEETLRIAERLWNDSVQLDNLLNMLAGIKALKQRGIRYSNEDFDVKQNLAAYLHETAVQAKA